MSILLSHIEPWHWLAFGIFLLVLEVLGASGFLLGIAIGAIITALLLAVMPDFSLAVQLTTFGILSFIATWIYWSRFRKFNQQTDKPLLNDRAAALIGRSVVVLEAVNNGRGKVQIGDALWTIESDQDIAEGETVEIIGVDSMLLKVKPKNIPKSDPNTDI